MQVEEVTGYYILIQAIQRKKGVWTGLGQVIES